MKHLLLPAALITTGITVTWNSRDAGIATVDDQGLVTGVTGCSVEATTHSITGGESTYYRSKCTDHEDYTMTCY